MMLKVFFFLETKKTVRVGQLILLLKSCEIVTESERNVMCGGNNVNLKICLKILPYVFVILILI